MKRKLYIFFCDAIDREKTIKLSDNSNKCQDLLITHEDNKYEQY